MPLVGFETATPAFERAKTVHALDGAATLIGKPSLLQTFNIVHSDDETKWKFVTFVGKGIRVKLNTGKIEPIGIF
jgi:hypothetical protein